VKTIGDYANNRKRGKPSRSIITKVARLFGEVEQNWLSQFPDLGEEPLLLVKDAILREQGELEEGDEVSLISSRAFLETNDSEVRALVLRKLDQGIVYKYYFPTPGSSSFENVAAESYLSFHARWIKNHSFNRPPFIFGYDVNPNCFRFFSGLHSIVRYYSRSNGVAKTYIYIEPVQGEYMHIEQVFYRVPNDVAAQIDSNLVESCDGIANARIPLQPLNPWLFRVANDYMEWFQKRENAVSYGLVRPILGHSGERCLVALKTQIGRIRLESQDTLRYLDVGCGDGVLTLEIAKFVASNKKVDVVGLDASSAQLQLAIAQFQDVLNVSFREHQGTFETFKTPDSFDLVTAIHSLYAVDEAYLRHIYNLLAPGGIALIWMAMRVRNVVTSICDAVDSVLRPGQRRNAAESVKKYAEALGLEPQLVEYQGTVVSLIDSKNHPNEAVRSLIDFCALQAVIMDSEAWEAAVTELSASTPADNGGHPLTDGMVVIRRRRV